jgi:type IV pilus assembly protein PilC
MFFFRRSRALILLYRQLSVLLRSGMTPGEAFGALDDFPFAAVRRRLAAIDHNLRDGASLAEAVAAFPELFGRIPPAVWKQDLSPEILGQIFADFAEETEKIAGMMGRLKRAMAYPLITLFIGFLVMSVLMVFVIPAFEKLYNNFGSVLPGPTRALMDLSNHMEELILAVLGLLLLILVLWIRESTLLYAIGGRLPILGAVLRRLGVYCFARDLSLLVRLGMPEFQAVFHAAAGFRYLPFARRLMEMEQKDGLKESLRAIVVFPRIFLQVVGVGERSGRVGEVLQEFSRYYEKEVESAYFRLLLVTEVLALVVVAVLIGWAAMAIYLPIFSMAGALV